jgi:hypothetical protein
MVQYGRGVEASEVGRARADVVVASHPERSNAPPPPAHVGMTPRDSGLGGDHGMTPRDSGLGGDHGMTAQDLGLGGDR